MGKVGGFGWDGDMHVTSHEEIMRLGTPQGVS